MSKDLEPHFDDVQTHYDLSDDFFRIFLDPTQTYSCAYFKRDDMSLEQAQIAKIDLSLGKLGLQPGMTLLDIGCGWGAMMLRAIEKYDVNVIGLTLSKNQATHVQKVFDELDSSRTRRVLLAGWEQFDEPVDRIVSIGAFEHFGYDRYDDFFTMAYSVLPDDGVMLLHTITVLNQQQVIERGIPLTSEFAGFLMFLNTEIFPGGQLPSIEMVEEASSKAGFTLTRRHTLRQHYAKTLHHWAAGAGGQRRHCHRDPVRRGLRALHALPDRLRKAVRDRLLRPQPVHLGEIDDRRHPENDDGRPGLVSGAMFRCRSAGCRRRCLRRPRRRHSHAGACGSRRRVRPRPERPCPTDTRASIGLTLPVNASPRITTAAVPGSTPTRVASA